MLETILADTPRSGSGTTAALTPDALAAVAALATVEAGDVSEGLGVAVGEEMLAGALLNSALVAVAGAVAGVVAVERPGAGT
jgi:hypothetical protein